jgi:MFS family permease
VKAITSRYSSQHYSRYVVFLLFITTVFSTADRTAISILLEDIRSEITMSDRQIGLLIGLGFTITHLGAAIPIARVADLYSRRLVLGASVFFWSLMTALTGTAQSFMQMLLYRLGLGLGEAGATPINQSLVVDYVPAGQRTRALSLLIIGGMAGSSLGLLIGGWSSELLGWRYAFFILGVPGMLLAVVLLLTLKEPGKGMSDGLHNYSAHHTFYQTLCFLFSIPTYRYLVISACIAGMASYGKLFWEPTFLRRNYGMGAADAGTWYILITSIPMAVGAWLSAYIADKMAHRSERWYVLVGLAGCVLVAPFSLLFLFAPVGVELLGMPIGFFPAIAAGCLGIFWSPVSVVLCQSLSLPHMRTQSAAIQNGLFTFFGMGIGPYLVGELSTRLAQGFGERGLQLALAIISCLPLLAALFMFMALRHVVSDMREGRLQMQRYSNAVTATPPLYTPETRS